MVLRHEFERYAILYKSVHKAIAEQPDVILLDLMMPKMDGYMFLDALWAKPEMQCIPVVFLTAQAGLLKPHDYETLGVKGIIAKPFAR